MFLSRSFIKTPHDNVQNKHCTELLSDVLTPPVPCQLRERKQFVSTWSVMRPPVRLLTHIRPLTVSLCHPLNLEKPF